MSPPAPWAPFDTEALRARYPVAELAERYGLALRGRGPQRYARCPFHAEQEPSLVIRLRTNRFRCYGCGAHGDSIDFVRQLEGVDFVRACELLGGERTGPPRPPRHRAAAAAADSLPIVARAVLAAAADIYHAALATAPAAGAYLRWRGVQPRAIRLARVGYCTGHDLGTELAARGLPLEEASRVGLLTADGRERLRGRVTVPVVVQGEALTLTGRVVTRGVAPRYLDLPLPPHLLGGDLVWRRPARRLVLVEGVLDYLVALGWGLPVVSPMGADAADEVRAEARAASASAEVVLLAFDNDEGGRRATAAWRTWLGPRAVTVAWPPGINDPGDLAQRPDGPATFGRLLADAERR